MKYTADIQDVVLLVLFIIHYRRYLAVCGKT